ncbi:hypothetical protein BJP34_05835 [Moorena producens PAL-8-15-08-1]|uniref:Uncharacterized protein n=1 Tax=Moorena producens PAL-8-15-08-1 TaxID=1458985 RepID=A0A1D8TN20_9CYAN|nr:hypothetical protein [Moorena producens]AOW99029.1 hypothetical protein BJP34_05835 [Moorena producens PAL-8-15-08-1]
MLDKNVKDEYGEGKHCPPYISTTSLHLLHLYLGWWPVLNNNVKGEYGEGKHCPPYISTAAATAVIQQRPIAL